MQKIARLCARMAAKDNSGARKGRAPPSLRRIAYLKKAQ